MFYVKRFMAFIAVGLLLIAARYYPSALERAGYGETVYYGSDDKIIGYADAYAYCRTDMTGGEETAKRIMKDMRAVLLFTENPDGEIIYYCFTPLLPRFEIVNGRKINLAIAVRGTAVTAGTPLIKGSY